MSQKTKVENVLDLSFESFARMHLSDKAIQKRVFSQEIQCPPVSGFKTLGSLPLKDFVANYTHEIFSRHRGIGVHSEKLLCNKFRELNIPWH